MTSLMVEEPNALINERDTPLLRRFKYRAIVLTARRSSNVLGA